MKRKSIAKGMISINKSAERSSMKKKKEEEILRVVEEKQLFGNDNLVTRGARTHTAVSTEKSELIVLDESAYESTIKV